MPKSRGRMVVLALLLPLLLGCGCCEWPWAIFEGSPARVTPDQAPGVWVSSCGGRVTLRDDGTYAADGLVNSAPDRPATGTGNWALTGGDNETQALELSGVGPFFTPIPGDAFEGFRYDIGDAKHPHFCELRRPRA